MKILKDPRHAPMLVPFALAGRMRLSLTAMVFFDLDDPTAELTDRELWAKVPALLPNPPVLDQGLPKPRGEMLVAGKCFAPNGEERQATRVSAGAGEARVTLDVFGDRYWRKLGEMRYGVTDPKPFTVMPLTWEKAFGGKDFTQNPKGMGLNPVALSGGEQAVPLPNIENPDTLMGSPDDRPAPAGCGMLAPDHPSRRSLAGTYDEAWRTERWPYFPDDFNPEYFMAAPQGQRIQDFFGGGEPIEIRNMHPDRQVISSNVPGLVIRAFITRKQSAKAPPEKDSFEEVPTRLDTVWLFPEILRGVAIYRGVTAIKDRDYPDELRCVSFFTEEPGGPARDIGYYLEAQTKRLAAMKPVLPEIPDVNKQVDREMLKFRRVAKDLKDAKAAATGKTPVMPREPEEMGAAGLAAIQGGLAVIDKMEAVSASLKGKFGWRVTHDPAAFQARRDALAKTAQQIKDQTAQAAQTKAGLIQMKAGALKEMGAAIKEKAPADELAKAGIDPDNLLPEKKGAPWHERGFPFAVDCRRALENDPALMAGLENYGLSKRTIAKAWLGYNKEPVPFDPAQWGLIGPAGVIPKGLVLPRFTEKNLTRLLVLPDWPAIALGEAAPYLAPGSDETPLWLEAPDEGAPVVAAASELEALLFEQEAGDVCAVGVLADPKAKPPAPAAAALKAAPVVMVWADMPSRENLSPAEPWLPHSDKAVWLSPPDGVKPLAARSKKLSLRDLILDGIPPAALGLDEPAPAPEFGPPPPRKRPPMPDIKGLVAAAIGEIRAFHEAKMAGFKASMKPVEDQARAELAKHGKDFDALMAEAKSAPRTPFDQIGNDMARDALARRDALKAQGVLTPDKEAEIVKAAGDAKRMGAEAEARWQAGQQALAEARKKADAARAAGGGMSEEMKASFKAAGMDVDRMVARTREEVEAMHARGETLALADLSGVDLSGLDLTGADFSGCSMRGAKLKNATLDGSTFTKTMAQEADFSGASLKNARFDRAMLMKTGFAKANLSGSNLVMASLDKANLNGADLSGATLSQVSLQKADLSGASLAGASARLSVLRGAKAEKTLFGEARFERCMLDSMALTGADFSRARFDSSQIEKCSGKGVSFAGAVFRKGGLSGCAMPGADFTGANATHLFLKESELPGADFRQSSFTRCRFGKCSLIGASLAGARLRYTALPKTDLENADLRRADLMLGSLARARLVGADLSGANLFGVNVHKAVVGNTVFTGANLKMTPLYQRADLIE